MIANKFLYLITLGIAVGLGPPVVAQVQTDVPAVVPGAKAVSVEQIKIHGKALEGNLEGDAVDREIFVFLPPSYAKEKSRHYPVVYALHGYSIGAEQWTHEIHVPQTHRRRFRPGCEGDDRRAAGFENSAQRFHVFEFGHYRRLRAASSRMTLSPILTRITAPFLSAAVAAGWPLHGRLRRDTHRHEALRCVRQSVHHEPLLLIAPAASATQTWSRR